MDPTSDNSSLSFSHFSPPDKTFLALFFLFMSSAVFSSTANGFLFYLTVRYRRLLWQPPYILLRNISACAVALSAVLTSIVVFSSASSPSPIGRGWCIAQFSILRCFFLTYHLTLAAMALERYVFICHGIDYLRIVNNRNVCAAAGLVWLLSAAVSLQGGVALGGLRSGFPERIPEPLCHAVAIKDHVRFSWEDHLLVFGPPSLVVSLCVLVVCYCYSCMYRTALRVTAALKCSHRRANATVGFYLLVFLLQLAPSVVFVALTLTPEGRGTAPRRTANLVTIPFLVMIPLCINVTFLIARNPLLKKRVLCRSRRRGLAVVAPERCRRRRGGRGVDLLVEAISGPSTPPQPVRIIPAVLKEIEKN